ncbi:hypothetical protein HKD37_16G045198 [Glycine soja]
MASRKRKSSASRPAAQYDTRRFQSLEAWNRYMDNILDRNILPERNVQIYYTEFDEFEVELESIDVVVVKEFYANLYTSEDQAPKQARVRGHLIKIDADSLNEFLQTPMRSNPQEIEARLCIPRKGFVLNVEGQPWKLLRKDLTTLAQTWSVFSYSNLAPTSHTSDLNMDRARLVYGLVTHMDMNIGALISSQISSIAQSNSSRLGFPTFITALCRARRVTSDSLTYESLSPAINLAYIKKNCWNVDDLTVNFRRARKARARPANVPSSSTPPAPSTSATPTPSPPGPSAQDSQRFDLHQGQILLIQSLQVVAPTGTILIVEQFMEKVAWPGTQLSLVREGEGPNAQVRQEIATPERSPHISPDPPSPVLADPPTPMHEMPADPSTPLLEIPEDPATPVLGLTTTPPASPVLHFTDAEGTQDQDT